MLSLSELRRVAAIFDGALRGHRVERWTQPDATRVAVSIYGRDLEKDEGRKRFILFCCAGELSRVSQIERLPQAPERPPAFSSYLRAHLPRAVIKGARLVDDDRQLAIRFVAREGEFELLLYVAHGTLHLLGWDDDTPERRHRMNARAAAILERAGIPEAAP